MWSFPVHTCRESSKRRQRSDDLTVRRDIYAQRRNGPARSVGSCYQQAYRALHTSISKVFGIGLEGCVVPCLGCGVSVRPYACPVLVSFRLVHIYSTPEQVVHAGGLG